MTAPSTNTLTVRYMDMLDISQVMEIDTVSFNPPWPERSYGFELTQSQVSYMLVIEKFEQQVIKGWRRWLNKLFRPNRHSEMKSVIVGYGGLWQVVEEAHISTIAAHPEYRGQKYGEILLVCMLRRAIMLQAEYVVLEVRVSNMIAQSLYKKYNFEIHGVKKGYYHHDKEDAYDMRLMLIPENISKVQQLYTILCDKLNFRDIYSNTQHPRLGK